jgi:alkylation response protein AidB-like acyl-CoA dehydrogenase
MSTGAMSSPREERLKTIEESVCPVLEAEAPAVDAEGRWPQKSIDAVGAARLLGLTLPLETGGDGLGMREFAAVTRKIAGSCASTAMIYLMHVCGAQVIAASGSSEKERVMRRIVSDKALATLAFSERGSRSHFWAPVSRAARNDGSTVLNCDKSFVTSAGYADYYVVSSGAVTSKGPTDSTIYLVERDAAGIEVSGRWNGLGLRGNASAPMVLRDCRIKDDYRLSEEAEGFKVMMGVVLPWFQVGSASVSLGIGDSAFAGAVKHTSTARLEHLGESLASALPGIRARLARMKLALDSAGAFLEQTLAAIEADSPSAMLSVLGVKAVAGEAALEVTDEAMRACGGAAFGRQLSVERNFRDARAASVMAPTTDVLFDFIGKTVAGIPLF